MFPICYVWCRPIDIAYRKHRPVPLLELLELVLRVHSPYFSDLNKSRECEKTNVSPRFSGDTYFEAINEKYCNNFINRL